MMIWFTILFYVIGGWCFCILYLDNVSIAVLFCFSWGLSSIVKHYRITSIRYLWVWVFVCIIDFDSSVYKHGDGDDHDDQKTPTTRQPAMDTKTNTKKKKIWLVVFILVVWIRLNNGMIPIPISLQTKWVSLNYPMDLNGDASKPFKT